MDGISFFSLLTSNISTYILSLFLSFICTYPLFRLYKFHFFHPYFIQFVFTFFANAVPIFLYFTGICDTMDFIYFILAELIFWIGYFSFINFKRERFFIFKIKDDVTIMSLMFNFFLVLFLLITIYSYLRFGIPLFLWSRVALYVDSDGFGLIGRIQPMLKIYCIFYAFEKIFNGTQKRKSIFYFVLFLFIIEGILSGSKSSFIYFIVVYYFYTVINKKPFLSKTGYFIITALIITTGILGVIIKGESIEFGLLEFSSRIIQSGDVYYYSLPEHLYKDVHILNPIKFIFTGFLAPARLIGIANREIHTGNQLFYLIYPKLEGLMSGPNSRMPFLSLVLFGWYGGLIFSFLSGCFFSILTNLSKIFFYGNKIFFPLYIYIITMLSAFIYDITLGLSNLFSICVNLFIFLLIMILFAIINKVIFSPQKR